MYIYIYMYTRLFGPPPRLPVLLSAARSSPCAPARRVIRGALEGCYIGGCYTRSSCRIYRTWLL